MARKSDTPNLDNFVRSGRGMVDSLFSPTMVILVPALAVIFAICWLAGRTP